MLAQLPHQYHVELKYRKHVILGQREQYDAERLLQLLVQDRKRRQQSREYLAKDKGITMTLRLCARVVSGNAAWNGAQSM
jgi:hypothetical protein